MSKKLFFSQFIKDFKNTGSVTPSSRFLVRKMISPINFSSAKVIVELGPGEGCITKKLLAKLKPSQKLYTFEVNSHFNKILNKLPYQNLNTLDRSALDIDQIEYDEEVDYVISSLPLALFSKKDKLLLFEKVQKLLKPGGAYVQFQYSLANDKIISDSFANVKRSYTPFNFPPAFVYTCRKS